MSKFTENFANIIMISLGTITRVQTLGVRTRNMLCEAVLNNELALSISDEVRTVAF